MGATTPDSDTPELNRFQSTRPRVGATNVDVVTMPTITVFQSTRPRVGATPFTLEYSTAETGVSIHAPARGRDLIWTRRAMVPSVFQSTRPRVGATSAMRSSAFAWM